MDKKRYTVPDVLRGFALIEMIIYHALWDIVFIFGINFNWFHGIGAYIWQQSICWIFIALSGFCANFSRNKFKRGLTILICSVIISIVTIIALPDSAVKFGVLCLIGSGMLIITFTDKILSKVSPIPAATISFLLFIVTKNIPFESIGFENIIFAKMPSILYQNNFTAFLGFPPSDFYSSDYFPLLPWLFLYITGYYIYFIFKKFDLIPLLSKISIPTIEWFGRRSLIIYMLHQPVIYGVLWIIFNVIYN